LSQSFKMELQKNFIGRVLKAVWLLACVGLFLYLAVLCILKLASHPEHSEVKYMSSKDNDFPSFTLCPSQNCNTFEDLPWKFKPTFGCHFVLSLPLHCTGAFVAIWTFVSIGTFVAIGTIWLELLTPLETGAFVAITTLVPLELLFPLKHLLPLEHLIPLELSCHWETLGYFRKVFEQYIQLKNLLNLFNFSAAALSTFSC